MRSIKLLIALLFLAILVVSTDRNFQIRLVSNLGFIRLLKLSSLGSGSFGPIEGNDTQTLIHKIETVANIGGNDSNRWSVLRTALLAGDVRKAADLAVGFGKHIENPLLFHDILSAYFQAGWYEELVLLYEANPSLSLTALQQEMISYSYMIRGNADDLQAALVLAPGDLCLAYKMYVKNPDFQSLQNQDSLLYFDLTRLSSQTDEHQQCVYSTIRELAERGLWDENILFNVVSYLVWHDPASEEIVTLMTYIVEKFPDNPMGYSYFGDLYDLRQDTVNALKYYQHSGTVDPSYPGNNLRIAQIVEEMSKNDNRLAANEVIAYYKRHLNLHPDDLLGIYKWGEFCESLTVQDDQKSECWSDFVSAIGDVDRYIQLKNYTQLSASNQGQVEYRILGSNLIHNGEFSKWYYGTPEFWQITDQALWNSPSNRGVFSIGQDSNNAINPPSVRIDGVSLEQDPQKEAGRFGVISRWELPVKISPNGWYAISFLYQTSLNFTGPLTIELIDLSSQDSIFDPADPLPPTGGDWRMARLVKHFDGDTPLEAALWIRSWGTGTLWLDDVTIFQVLPVQ